MFMGYGLHGSRRGLSNLYTARLNLWVETQHDTRQTTIIVFSLGVLCVHLLYICGGYIYDNIYKLKLRNHT